MEGPGQLAILPIPKSGPIPDNQQARRPTAVHVDDGVDVATQRITVDVPTQERITERERPVTQIYSVIAGR